MPSPAKALPPWSPLSRSAGEKLKPANNSPSPAPRERVPSAARRVRVLLLPLVIGTTAAAEPPPGATSCSGCHLPTASTESKVAPLRGQKPADIVAAMQAFRSGERPSTVMGRIAKGFSDEEIHAIAAWVAEQR